MAPFHRLETLEHDEHSLNISLQTPDTIQVIVQETPPPEDTTPSDVKTRLTYFLTKNALPGVLFVTFDQVVARLFPNPDREKLAKAERYAEAIFEDKLGVIKRLNEHSTN